MRPHVGNVNATFTQAKQYRDAGISVVPIRRDGSKVAANEWKPYQFRLATDQELARWFSQDKPLGIAALSGAISENLDRLDFDEDAETIFKQWSDLVEREQPGLVGRLTIIRTPRPGFAVMYRCESAVPGNAKLAERPVKDSKPITLIETRGEGGYSLVPGCPAECHTTNRLYEYLTGPHLHAVTTITDAERETLIRCAKSFDESVHTETSRPQFTSDEGRPGDDFNQRGTWGFLADAGWRITHTAHGKTYWARPGKNGGWSATTGHCKTEQGNELFAVFSSNAHPFDGPNGGAACSCYSKFSAYAILNHNKDWKAAAKALAAQGYGRPAASGQSKSQQQQASSEAPPEPLPTFTLGSLLDHFEGMHEPVIEGLLRRGETMNVIAPPKFGKSWAVISLALAGALGNRWLDFRTTPGDVLVIDNELHKKTIASRFRKIIKETGAPLEEVRKKITIMPLRGRRQRDIPFLGTYFRSLERDRYRLVIIDAFYRSLPVGVDENDNAQMAELYNVIDEYADHLGSAFTLVHHASKGNQSAKSVTDVGSGAGSQSRAADTHLVLRPHAEENVFVLEAAVRSFPPVAPRCLRWQFPTFTVADDLDPTDLQKPNAKQKKPEPPKEEPAKWDAERFVKAYGTKEPQPQLVVLDKARKDGLSDRLATILLNTAIEYGWLFRHGTKVATVAPTPPEPAAEPESKAREEDKTSDVRAFIDAKCTRNPPGTNPSNPSNPSSPSELYSAYLKWCSESGAVEMTQTAFGIALTALGHPSVKDKGNRVREGLTLKLSGGLDGLTGLAPRAHTPPQTPPERPKSPGGGSCVCNDE